MAHRSVGPLGARSSALALLAAAALAACAQATEGGAGPPGRARAALASEGDLDGDGTPDKEDPDRDGDGILDVDDDDWDGDGEEDNDDEDEDGDGEPNEEDDDALVPLDQEPRPAPAGLHVVDQAAAVRLGKAFFWDVQAGSDGQTACASCHFHAGADDRRLNTLDPGPDGTFASGGVSGPGQTFTPASITNDDRVGSQGVAAGPSWASTPTRRTPPTSARPPPRRPSAPRGG